jgi:hypothetical protein
MKSINIIPCIVMLLSFQSFSFSQIDSSRLQFFPLHKGDVWQYLYGNEFGSGYYRNQVVTTIDTAMPNGLHYTRVDGAPKSGTKYFRIDSLLRIQEYINTYYDSAAVVKNEANVFRLNEKDSTVYSIGYNIADQLGGPPYIFRYNGIFLKREFGADREIMDFQAGYRRTLPRDTAYNYHCLLLKGFGVYRIEYGENLWVQLTGAIIDGQQFGLIHTDVNNDNPQPLSFGLEQNYPNPFNGTTTIIYNLSRAGRVSIMIYDMLGREVKTVMENYLPAGEYSIHVELPSQPSGVYIYRMRAENQIISKFMMLIK